jgi:hypothetical protein
VGKLGTTAALGSPADVGNGLMVIRVLLSACGEFATFDEHSSVFGGTWQQNSTLFPVHVCIYSFGTRRSMEETMAPMCGEYSSWMQGRVCWVLKRR